MGHLIEVARPTNELPELFVLCEILGLCDGFAGHLPFSSHMLNPRRAEVRFWLAAACTTLGILFAN